MNDPITVTPLAGARQLDANAYLVRWPGACALLDCGAAHPRAARWVDQLEDVPEVLVLSHVHSDHLGALPELMARAPRLRPWASPGSVALAPEALRGVLRARGVERRALDGRAQALSEQLRALPMLRPRRIAPGVEITLYPCGHILGAASVLFDIEREEKFHRIFYLPDFCAHDQPLTPAAALPVPGPERPIDLLLIEGVLAADRRADELDYGQNLGELLAELEAHQGPRLLAMMSLGEAPELLAALLGRGLDVLAHEHLEPIYHAYLEHTPEPARSPRFAARGECDRALRAGGIVIAPGEHLDRGTPARWLVDRVLAREDAWVVLCNSLRHDSFAARLLEGKVGRAKARRYLLPNHAPRWAIRGAVRALEPRQVALIHGRQRALGHLKAALRADGYDGPIHIPANGDALSVGVSAR